MKKAIILCASCGWKTVSDRDSIGLVEIKNDSLSSKKYRCPGCGRAVSPRNFSDPQKDQDNKKNEEKMKEENEAWLQENLDFHKSFMEETSDEK
jgi:DNA-directed RNA polymerase subunit RPC12/RpoP